MEDSEILCRICHEQNPLNDLIAPCQCSGSIKWVHRQCLDMWRSVSPNPESFTTCDNCKFKYRIIEKRMSDTCLKMKFIMKVALDFVILLFVVNALVLGLGFLGELIDPTSTFIQLFPGGSYISQHLMLRVYCFGGLMFCCLLGFIGLCITCWSCCASSRETHFDPISSPRCCIPCYFVWCGPYFDPVYGYYWGPCWYPGYACALCLDCRHGDACRNSGSGGDSASVALIILCILVIILVVLGIIFGIILTIFIVSRVLHRHYHILQRSHNCQIWHVVNLADPKEVEFANSHEVTIVVPPTLPSSNEQIVNPSDDKFDAVKAPLLQ